MAYKEALLRKLREQIGAHVDFIKANPSEFKVCEGCDRAIDRKVDVCPVCHAYRFDPSPLRVIERASFRQDAVEKYYATLPRF